MWHLIRKVVSKTPATARHHTPDASAQQLVNAWSEQSTLTSLPIHMQGALSSRAPVRRLGLASALLQDDDDEAVQITEGELRRALSLDVKLRPLAMTVLPTQCYACCNAFPGTPCFACITFVFKTLVYYESGPAAPLYPSPSPAWPSSGLFPFLFL